MNLLKMSLEELTHVSYDCDCGKCHTIDIGAIEISENVSEEICKYASPYLGGRIFVVCDENTHAVLGKRVIENLKKECADVASYIFTEHHLIPNAQTLGTLLIEASEIPCGLIVAVGSGTINDTARYVASRLKIPYIIVGTAPSMDGYANDSSPIVCRDNKETFQAIYPIAILADTKIMAQAPEIMISAGFGDVLGKYIALADWELARREIGEYYCQTISDLMKNAVEKCVSCIQGVKNREPKAVGELVEALCLAGMTMGLAKVTRPASGSEHHLTHYCDIYNIKRGRDYPLHGNSVGVFTIVMAKFYEMARKDGYTDIETPAAELIENQLLAVGAPIHPMQIGIDRDMFKEAMINAKDLRPRYAMLTYAHEKGFLEEYTNRLLSEYYR